MSDIRESLVELIGKTPMLRLLRYENEKKAQAELYAKLEYGGRNRKDSGKTSAVHGRKEIISTEQIIGETAGAKCISI